MNKKIFVISFVLLLSLGFAFDGAKYLIITHDNFTQSIQPLATWKTQKGMPAKVVPLSVTGNTANQIRNYILEAYNTWRIRPEYILLVGSGGYIPSWSIGNGDYSDDYYADVTGDYKIDISIGRFPCSTTGQCDVMVAKTLGYERTPYMTDTTWYRKATSIVREDGSTHPDTIYWNNIRYVQSFWRDVGFTLIDSFSRLRGDDASDIQNAITNGRSYVAYRGEATVNWYTPFQVNTNSMNNGYKLPIVVSGTCGTLSLSSQTGYLGDRFLTAGSTSNPRGAVGFFGSSVSTSGSGLANCRGIVTKGFFSSQYNENQYKLGDAARRAKFIIDSIRPPYFTENRYKEWNLFGDPELNMWTRVPRQMTVTHDSVINTRPQTFTVSVQQGTSPLSGALVCIMMDTIIYECSYTNSSGIASFSIYPQISGTISVTVTAQNYFPYIKLIPVHLVNIEHDVGILSIIEPQGTNVSGINIVPRIKLENYGTHTDSFPVTFKIGSIYNQTISSVILPPGDTTTIVFPVWTAVTGTYQVMAFTALNYDEWHDNDTLIGNLDVVIGPDVGIEAILCPDSLYPINTLLTPSARVKNYGASAQSNFTTTCSIINSTGNLRYADTQIILTLLPDDTVRVNFHNWTPTTTELCTVKIRTNLIGDENTDNDQKIQLTFMFTAIHEERPETNSLITGLNTIKPNLLANGVTHISYTLSTPDFITLQIYDITGCVVKTLVNDNKTSGIYTYTWDGKDERNKKVPEGIYFCTLNTTKQNYTQKIIKTR